LELQAAIEAASPRLSASVFAAEVAKRVPDLANDVYDILQILVPMYRAYVTSEATPEDFVEHVQRALEDADDEDLIPPDGDWDVYKQRLLPFLRLDRPLGVVSKATYLWTEHEHVFTEARIFSDIRPVFGANPEEDPTAAVLTHSLMLTYRDRNTTKELFLMLGSSDLAKLRQAVNRAERKDKSLRRLLASTPMAILEEDDDEG